MPASAIAGTLGDDVENVLKNPTHTITRLVTHFITWSPNAILGGVRVWMRLLRFIDADPVHFVEGSYIKGSIVTDFLLHVDSFARQNAADRVARNLAAEDSESEDCDDQALPSSTARMQKRANNGLSAAISAGASLRWLRDRAAFDIRSCPSSKTASSQRSSKSDDSSTSFTPGIIIRLEYATINLLLYICIYIYVYRYIYTYIIKPQTCGRIVVHGHGAHVHQQLHQPPGYCRWHRLRPYAAFKRHLRNAFAKRFSRQRKLTQPLHLKPSTLPQHYLNTTPTP
jgi:hypothetical protein